MQRGSSHLKPYTPSDTIIEFKNMIPVFMPLYKVLNVIAIGKAIRVPAHVNRTYLSFSTLSYFRSSESGGGGTDSYSVLNMKMNLICTEANWCLFPNIA